MFNPIILTTAFALTASSALSASSIVSALNLPISSKAKTLANDAFHTATNDLALELYKKLGGKNKNLCFSPYSIQSAMSMTLNGADGETLREMQLGLSHGNHSPSAINASFKAYQEDLEKRLTRKVPDYISTSPTVFKTANRLFGEQNFKFKDAFLNVCKDEWNAPLEAIDFKNDSNASRLKINDWIADQTKDKIKDLLPIATVNSDTRLILTNAVYFNGDWKYGFKKIRTFDKDFTDSEGTTSKVSTMHNIAPYGYKKENGYEAISLPYGHFNNFQLLVILPEQGSKVKDVVAQLNSAELTKMRNLPTQKINLALPKFKITGGAINLSDTFSSLGIKKAFGPNADFSKMESSRMLYLDNIFHKALIELDEKGTEAAAATAASVACLGLPRPEPEPLMVQVDRPFFYAIQNTKTGTCHFIGEVQSLK